MISKPKLKYIKSLQVKKYRKQEQSFVVEGAKGVQEVLKSRFDVTTVCGTEVFIERNQAALRAKKAEAIIVSEKELEQLGSFQSNDAAIAVARMLPNMSPELARGDFALVLDDIRDPGNLGTIIRTADWYGLSHIIASMETADLYNPKVISATMGSFTRINVYYTELAGFIKSSGLPVYGTFLDGDDIHHTIMSSGGLIVVGNESNGISLPVAELVTTRITIPRLGKAESLNAAVATAVILDNAARRRG
jgi:TrmH family RNA methyltransferase